MAKGPEKSSIPNTESKKSVFSSIAEKIKQNYLAKRNQILENARAATKAIDASPVTKYIKETADNKWMESLRDSEPKEVLKNADKIKHTKEGQALIEKSSNKNYEKTLEFGYKFDDSHWGKKLVEKAIIKFRKHRDEGELINYFQTYKKYPGAEKLIRQKAKDNSYLVISNIEKFLDQPYADEVIYTALNSRINNPDEVPRGESLIIKGFYYLRSAKLKDQFMQEWMKKQNRNAFEVLIRENALFKKKNENLNQGYSENNFKNREYKDSLHIENKYIDQAANDLLAKKNYISIANNIEHLEHRPDFKEIVKTVFLSIAGKPYTEDIISKNGRFFRNKPYAEKVFRAYLKIRPEMIFSQYNGQEDPPFAKQLQIDAIESLKKQEKYYTLLEYIHYYMEIEGGVWQKTLKLATNKVIETDPARFLRYINIEEYKKIKELLGEKYIEKAMDVLVEKDPKEVFSFNPSPSQIIKAFKADRGALLDQPLPRIKFFGEAILKYGNETDKKALKFTQEIKEKHPNIKFLRNLMHIYVKEGKSIEELLRITDPTLYTSTLTNLYYKSDIINEHDVIQTLERQSLVKVRNINHLHDSSDKIRFASTENLNARDIYTLITIGEAEVFTSTFKGLFSRLLEKMQTENLSGEDLLKSVGNKNFRAFLKICARFNKLEAFLKTMSEAKSKETLKLFISDIEKNKKFLDEAVNVADFFASIKDPKLLEFMQKELLKQYKRVENKSKNGQKVYGLLSGMFGQGAMVNAEWFKEMSEKYIMENVATIKSQELYNENNTNVQQYFFYDDADGHASFRSFLAKYKNSKWKIETKDTYVKISAQSGERKMVIYANKPEAEDDGPKEIEKELKDQKIKSIVIVHRGHSYHAAKTIARITDIAKVVSLGSCGGYSNLRNVLKKSPNAHIISTKGTGTMTVNDPVFKAFNDKILAGEDINWQSFWEEMTAKLKNNKDFHDYIPPHRNLGVMFLKAYNKLPN